MSNNKQSSVDILLKELEEIGVLNIKNCHWSDEVDVKKAIEQAKAMHKGETLKLYYAYEDYVLREEGIIKTFGQFYNETFGE